jgi:hypothetical protein
MADKKSKTSGKKRQAAGSAPPAETATDNGAEPVEPQPSEAQPSSVCCEEKPVEPAAPTGPEPGNIHKQQRSSLILRAVLEQEPPPESSTGHKLRYPWYADLALALGLLVAVAGFTVGLFKMYITHKAQQCIVETDYTAAIALLKGNPLPPIFNLKGNDRAEDPEELLARALYLDAMHKLDDENDIEGAKGELQQIRAGTHYFNEAQKILAENFQPSGTTLTGGVVQNDTVNNANK